MPKIEINEKLFFSLLGEKPSYDDLEQRLTSAKAELDERGDQTEAEPVIKIELNDTNRPDLWSAGGLTRSLKLYAGGAQADYEGFLSYRDTPKDAGKRIVHVDPALQSIRPFMTAFVVSGKAIDEGTLLDIIQTQEKLCWNYGRKRRSVSMGIYRSAHIRWPIHYYAADPDSTSFVPLHEEREMSLREILKEHPKGREYGWILEGAERFPLLKDDSGAVMSMAPIINSAGLGSVQVGDCDLLVEMTGTDMPSLLLSANIVACNFYDSGYEVLPCTVSHPYDTGFGKYITVPFYFQSDTELSLSYANRLLGRELSQAEVADALRRMGNRVEVRREKGDCIIRLSPPPYRNDFLHAVDIIEDIMIGAGLQSFSPEKPRDFTIGRLSALTLFGRRARELMTGLGYQEMIFNYLGSKRDYIERMNIDDAQIIEISNPMSENYQFVRPSIIPSLLSAESVSAHAVYPHKIFEIGKTAVLCKTDPTGTRTTSLLGFLTASTTANFNEAASDAAALLYFLDIPYQAEESSDPRFIPGRQVRLTIQGRDYGIFGELHPAVLENWDIKVPCTAGEIDLELLISFKKTKEESPHAVQKTDQSRQAGTGQAGRQALSRVQQKRKP